MLMPPRFNLNRDWNLMHAVDPAVAEEDALVSFEGFEAWWKSRICSSDGSVPVIPEYIAQRCVERSSHFSAFLSVFTAFHRVSFRFHCLSPRFLLCFTAFHRLSFLPFTA